MNTEQQPKKKQYIVVAKNCSIGVGVASPLAENIEADRVRTDESGCLLFENNLEMGERELVRAFAVGHWSTFTKR